MYTNFYYCSKILFIKVTILNCYFSKDIFCFHRKRSEFFLNIFDAKMLFLYQIYFSVQTLTAYRKSKETSRLILLRAQELIRMIYTKERNIRLVLFLRADSTNRGTSLWIVININIFTMTMMSMIITIIIISILIAVNPYVIKKR